MSRIGIQVSIRDSIGLAAGRAQAIGCETVQVFSCNPRSWQAKPLGPKTAAELGRKLDAFGIRPLVVHVTYLPNLASPDAALYRKSVSRVVTEVRRAGRLSAQYFVLHLGHHRGTGEERGIERVARAAIAILKRAEPSLTLLLENSCGGKGGIGGSFEQIAGILDRIGGGGVGVCFDTAHGFAAGYDLRTPKAVDQTVRAFDACIGIGRLHVIHANDSKVELGSRLDRHEHIGKGCIGRRGFRAMLAHPALRHLPFILETPVKQKGDDAKNVRALKSLRKI